MTELIRVPGRRLGRRPPTHAPALHVGRYLTGHTPAHPATADHLTAVPRWLLGGNDRHGTCGPTYLANYLVMAFKYLLGKDITVSDAAIFDLYRRSGNPGFNPDLADDDPRQDDNGVVMQDMLNEFLSGGMEITHQDGTTEVVKPIAFAQVDTGDFDEVRAATSLFGGVGFGLDLEVAQRRQTDEGGPWDYEATGEWGGHATLGGRYTSEAGAHQVDESLVSWAEVLGTTDEFMVHQLQEAWAVILPAHLEHPDFQQGIDLEALAADYKQLTGRELPLPAPKPAPGPEPQPGPGTLPPLPPPPPSAEVWVWLRQVVDWLEHALHG